MSRIITVHSARGGTGKSCLVANVATVLARQGHRVAIVDTDLASPGIHVLFGIDDPVSRPTLNEYLWDACPIAECAHDVSQAVGSADGSLYLVPSSMARDDVARILSEGYDVGLLNDGLHHLLDELQLDVVLNDTHPGLAEETLLSSAVSDTFVVVLRPDAQDYRSTALLLAEARRLDVPRTTLVVNLLPPGRDATVVARQVSDMYGYKVSAVLPYIPAVMELGSVGVFVARHPEHPYTSLINELADRLLEDEL